MKIKKHKEIGKEKIQEAPNDQHKDGLGKPT